MRLEPFAIRKVLLQVSFCGFTAFLPLTIVCSGAFGAGLALFSRFPITAASVHPYSLNGTPIDVSAGDWFVGKAAASIVISHPVLNEVQIFNTHVCLLILIHPRPS
jgi:hypothetical protein